MLDVLRPSVASDSKTFNLNGATDKKCTLMTNTSQM